MRGQPTRSRCGCRNEVGATMKTETSKGISTTAPKSAGCACERALVSFVAMGLAIVLGVAACASLQDSGSTTVPAKSLMKPYYGPPYGWR